MSLLDRGNVDITVYPEVETTDVDGNPMTGPSAEGVPARAMLQPLSSDETAERGFTTEAVYRLRLTRAYERQIGVLGAQSQIEWGGDRWSLLGDPRKYNVSRRTAHDEYTVRRA